MPVNGFVKPFTKILGLTRQPPADILLVGEDNYMNP